MKIGIYTWHWSTVALYVCIGTLFCLFVLSGCSDLSNWTLDPNSAFNATGDAINKVTDTIGVVGAIGGVIGGPIGSALLLGSTLFSTGWGTWQRKRKMLAESKRSDLSKVTETLVAVIDSVVSESADSSTIKSKIKDGLEANMLFSKGKAIISEIKEGIKSA